MMRSMICAALVPVAACVAAAQDTAPQPEQAQAKMQQVVDMLKRDGLLGNGVYGDNLNECDFSALVADHMQLYMSGKEGIEDFPWLPMICREYRYAAKPIPKDVVRLLLEAGADANSSQSEENVFSLIVEDYDKQDPELIDLLLAAGLELNPKLPAGSSDVMTRALRLRHEPPLGLAVAREKVELAKKLLAAGASPNSYLDTWRGNMPLISLAIHDNRPDFVHMLIDAGADVNAKSDKDVSPLEYACSQEGLAAASVVVPMLEAAGAQAREDKCSPLIRACAKGDVEAVKKMIENGLDVNKPDAEGIPPLIYAAAVGNKEICALLVSAGADVNTGATRGVKALSAAVSYHRLDVVDYLLSNGAKVETGDDNQAPSLLMHAVSQKGCSEEMVKRLIAAGAKINAKADGIPSILSLAIIGGNKHLVDMIIDAGADVNVQLDDDEDSMFFYLSPLYAAVAAGDVPLCEKLLNHGAKITPGNSFALLTRACELAQQDILNLLIKHGADVNAGNGIGETALSMFIDRSRYRTYSDQGYYANIREKVMSLIRARADVNASLKSGKSLLAELKDNSQICEILVDAGVELNDEDESGMMVFEEAVSQGNAALCKKLVAAGLKVRRWRPLHLAAVLGQVDKVKELLAAGAKPDVLRKSRTPLIYAARMGNVEVCKALIEAGANVNAVDHKGISPLSAAASARHAEVCRLLLDSGADVSIKVDDDPLIFSAIIPCNSQVVEMLIDAGADVSGSVAGRGRTPLMFAVAKGMPRSLIRKMMQAGADAKAVDEDGNSALLYALVPTNIVRRNLDSPLCRDLIEAGADVNLKNKEGVSPQMVNDRKSGVSSGLLYSKYSF